MKNETARREIESLDYYLQNHTDDYSEESHTAMMMAIKALEAQPFINKPCISEGVCREDKIQVLDKIRAEIERKAHSGQWSDATIYGMLKAVAIIDKYREGGAE
jgi:hypothetical protein